MARVALRAIIDRSVEATKPLIEDKKHQLTVSVLPDPIMLDAAPTRLEQIFTNLISNAAKYTEPGGQILVGSRLEGSECVVSVKDNGVGLSAEMLPLVFDLFTQVGASLHRSKGGLGIGLTLVKKLAEQHGGSVQARSQIALTGYGQEEDRRPSLEAGIDRHLVKPVEFNSCSLSCHRIDEQAGSFAVPMRVAVTATVVVAKPDSTAKTARAPRRVNDERSRGSGRCP
ncbi:MAG: ATP-binding protein [Isosphaerales bacterium]